MLRRLLTGTAAATTLVLALTGCLGEGKERADQAREAIKQTAAQVLGKAAQKSGQINSFRMGMSIAGTAEGQTTQMNARIEMRLRPDVAMGMNFDSMNVGGQRVPAYEMRVVGDAMYMKMPGLEEATGGKPWGRVAISELSRDITGGLNMQQAMEQARRQSPAEQTKMFTASKNAREVGTETVEGVRTRHYAGTVSVEEALAQLDAENQQAMRQSYQQLGVTEIPFDVWVGDDDLPRKISVKVAAGANEMTTTATYSDYNRPVNVVAPATAETGDLNLPGLRN
ncbi:hypothetical protein [Spirillospora sp. NPDC029432]|uniref:hypothetical protein n=1 Tax=Spirillospora sp. NPDC029432 TaxID=3154599 RepID=UPI003453D157